MSLSRHAVAVQRLYRQVLNLHRCLPLELKALGDQYAKDEFRRHKNASPEQAAVFMKEWKVYAETIEQQVKSQQGLGVHLSEKHVDCLSEEQLGQLYSLHQEATKSSDNEEKNER